MTNGGNLATVNGKKGEPFCLRGCMNMKIFWNVKEVASALSVGRSTVFELIKAGLIESGKIGGRRLVSVASVQAYAASLTRSA